MEQKQKVALIVAAFVFCLCIGFTFLCMEGAYYTTRTVVEATYETIPAHPLKILGWWIVGIAVSIGFPTVLYALIVDP